MRRLRGSFPRLARCERVGKRRARGAPRLQRPGLSPRRGELRVRAGRGWEEAEVPLSALRRPTRARPRNDGARGNAAECAGARRLTPPPAPTHRVLRSSPRPFLFPRREGPGARPVRVAGPAQAQCLAGRASLGPHLRSTPPSREALRHSGGERRRCTSATVTLYFEVELRSERRPGTEQKTSLGFTTPPKRLSLLMGMAETALLLDLDRDTGPAETDGEAACGRRGSLPSPARPRPSSRPGPAPRLAPQPPLFFQP